MSGTQGLFGGGAAGDDEKTKAQDFINRYQTGDPAEGYSEQEAIEQLQAISKVATPEQMQLAFKQSVARLPDNERAQFNQMLQDRQAGTGMVDIERSGDRKDVSSRDSSGGDAPGLDDLLGGLLGGMAGGSAGSSGGGLGDILGGLLGGGAGGSGESRRSGDSGGGITDILGGMMGGEASDAPAPAPKREDSDDGGIGDLISGFLGSPAGKAVLAGTAAFAMKEVLGQ